MYSIIISLVLFNTLHSGAFISFLFSVFITPNFLPFVAVDMVEVDLKLYTLKKFHKRLFDKQLSSLTVMSENIKNRDWVKIIHYSNLYEHIVRFQKIMN